MCAPGTQQAIPQVNESVANSGRGPVGRILAELRRRHVFRTLALYILGAWVLMQVADVLLPALSLPESSIRYLLFAAIAGFPLALVFGWFFDITAGGIRLTPATDPDLIEVQPLQGFDYTLLVALVAVLALIGYGLSDAVLELPEEMPAMAEADLAPRTEGPPMVGVLPFAHMGSGEDGDFFASGIHDDLLTRLAKLQGMRVVSRTSVMGYAGTTKKIPEIGRELRADAILEGGVRVAGDQIRINAQLIDARSDEHLWAETYDRRLTASNIFEVQSEIARAIAAALQTTLTPEDSAELTLIPTENLAAYRAFHETMQWRDTVTLSMDSANKERFERGMRHAFELDPEYTRPMLELVMHLALDIYFGRGEESLPEVEALIDRIGEVAPNSADFYAAQAAYFYYVMRDFDRAEALLAEAQKKAPSDTRLIEIESWIKRRQGDYEGWIDASRRARDLDPRSQRNSAIYISRLMIMHRYDEAWRELQSVDQPHQSDEFARSLLKLREHHDVAQYAAELEEILRPLSEQRRPQILFVLWEAQLAADDLAGSRRTLDQILSIMNVPRRAPDDPPVEQIPNDLGMELGHAVITGDEARAAELALEIKRVMGLEGLSVGEYPEHVHPLDRVQLAFVEGEREFVIEWASAYWQDPSVDRADWLNSRVFACQALGLSGAAEQAVACLRNVFAEPSSAHPFYEPLQPMYDPIRDKPAFKALVAELVAEGWLALPE
jgi:TolB-like protein